MDEETITIESDSEDTTEQDLDKMANSIEKALAPFLDENNVPTAKAEFQFQMGKRKLYQQISKNIKNSKN